MEEKENKPLLPKKEKQTGSKSVMKMLLLGLLSTVVLGIVVVIAVFTFGIYWMGWQGSVTRTAIDTIPYPVAKVNNQSILYSEYLEDVDTLKMFFANQVAEGAPAEAVPSESDMQQNALDRLIFTAVLEQEAANRGLEVTEAEIEEEFSNLVAQSGGEESLAAELEALYGWEPVKFKLKVLYPYLLQQKLGEALTGDDVLNADAREKAEKLLAQLQEGVDFAEMARLNSDDPVSAAQDGDLGWFERGMMVPEFEEAAFSLEPGELSGLVKTQFGYHVIKVDENEEEEGEVTRVKARHILIATMSVEEFIDARVKESDVSKYVDI